MNTHVLLRSALCEPFRNVPNDGSVSFGTDAQSCISMGAYYGDNLLETPPGVITLVIVMFLIATITFELVRPIQSYCKFCCQQMLDVLQGMTLATTCNRLVELVRSH